VGLVYWFGWATTAVSGLRARFALYVTGYSAFRIFEESLRVDYSQYFLQAASERLHYQRDDSGGVGVVSSPPTRQGHSDGPSYSEPITEVRDTDNIHTGHDGLIAAFVSIAVLGHDPGGVRSLPRRPLTMIDPFCLCKRHLSGQRPGSLSNHSAQQSEIFLARQPHHARKRQSKRLSPPLAKVQNRSEVEPRT